VTLCPDWSVSQLVDHLIGMNLVFAALLAGDAPPRRNPAHVEDDPAAAYQDSAVRLLAAFGQPEVLERTYRGPSGRPPVPSDCRSGSTISWPHGWDLAQATGQPAELPDDVAEQALTFVCIQLSDEARPGRFGPPEGLTDPRSGQHRLPDHHQRVPISPTLYGTAATAISANVRSSHKPIRLRA
jgi:uncharacterized protein (TIGR03086 family)